MHLHHHSQPQQHQPHPGGAVPSAPHQVPVPHPGGPAQHYPHPSDLQSPRYSPGMMHHSGSFERESSDDEMRSEQVCCLVSYYSLVNHRSPIFWTPKTMLISCRAHNIYSPRKRLYCFHSVCQSIRPCVHNVLFP